MKITQKQQNMLDYVELLQKNHISDEQKLAIEINQKKRLKEIFNKLKSRKKIKKNNNMIKSHDYFWIGRKEVQITEELIEKEIAFGFENYK